MSLSEFDLVSGGLTAFAARTVDAPMVEALRRAVGEVREVIATLHSDIDALRTSRLLTEAVKQERGLELLQAAAAKLDRIEGSDYGAWQKNADTLRSQLAPRPLPGDGVVTEMQCREVRDMVLAVGDPLQARGIYLEAIESNDLVTVCAFERAPKYVQHAMLGPDLSVIDEGMAARARKDNPSTWTKFQAIQSVASAFADAMKSARHELQSLGLAAGDPLVAIAGNLGRLAGD